MFSLLLFTYFGLQEAVCEKHSAACVLACLYAWGEPLYIFLMILSICFNYVFARLIAAERHKSESIYGSRHRAESASYLNFQICRLFC